MQTETQPRVVNEEQITDPSMSAAPRRVSKARVGLIVLLVLGALGFASAIYLDNSRGSLTDEQGIIDG